MRTATPAVLLGLLACWEGGAAWADPGTPALAAWNQPRARGLANQARNNCYNYGTNKQTGTFAQPGRGGRYRARNPVAIQFVHTAPTLAGVLNLKAPARVLDAGQRYYVGGAVQDGLRQIARPADARADECVVALVIGYIPIQTGRARGGGFAAKYIFDHHWIRRNGDGSWSHKPGKGTARTRDDSRAAITDPSAIITAGETRSRYDRFVGYFAFKPADITIQRDDGKLVDLESGNARIIAHRSSGREYGWAISPDEVPGVVDLLVDLREVPAPGDEWLDGREGWVLEGGVNSLGDHPDGRWAAGDEVRATARQGIIRLHVGKPSGEVEETWLADGNGFEAFAEDEVLDRELEDNPGRVVVDLCYADADDDGQLTIFDYLAFFNAFESEDPYADCDADGEFTIADFLCFQNEFAAGCP